MNEEIERLNQNLAIRNRNLLERTNETLKALRQVYEETFGLKFSTIHESMSEDMTIIAAIKSESDNIQQTNVFVYNEATCIVQCLKWTEVGIIIAHEMTNMINERNPMGNAPLNIPRRN